MRKHERECRNVCLLVNYDLHYLTGGYPEGNTLLDLYIHPLDLVCHLFGQPKILAYRQVDVSTPLSLRRGDGGEASYILMLQHPHIVGTLELSTAYSWTTAEESMKVCTRSGVYNLSQMESLTFTPNPTTILSIPIEKLHKKNSTVEYLYHRNSFVPTLVKNQLYAHGYFNEITAFVNAVEGNYSNVFTNLGTTKSVYETIKEISG